MQKFNCILERLSLLDVFHPSHPLVENYTKCLYSIYTQLLYHNNGDFYEFPKGEKTEEEVLEYMMKEEERRTETLMSFIYEYGLDWYPLRILEFDEWARKNCHKKGRGKYGDIPLKKYAEYLYYNRSEVRMVNVYVKLLSGDIFEVSINANEGSIGLERTLNSTNRDIFPYNHMVFLESESKEYYPSYFIGKDFVCDLEDGDIVNVFVNAVREENEKVQVETCIRNENFVVVNIYYNCLMSVRKVVGDKDGGKFIIGFNFDAKDDTKLRFYYHKTDKNFHMSMWNNTNIGENMNKVLQYFESVLKFRFTDKAMENILSQWEEWYKRTF